MDNSIIEKVFASFDNYGLLEVVIGACDKLMNKGDISSDIKRIESLMGEIDTTPLLPSSISYKNTLFFDAIDERIFGKQSIDKERYIHPLLIRMIKISDILYPSPQKEERDRARDLFFLLQIDRSDYPKLQEAIRFIMEQWMLIVNTLDSVCLKNNIDFIKIQEEVGIRVSGDRNAEVISIFLHSKTLAEKYITELPKQKQNVQISFKSSFICEEAYNKALCWLEEKGHFQNGKYTLNNPKETTMLFLTLQKNGYVKTGLTTRTRENISNEIGAKYGKSGFAAFDKIEYSMDDIKNRLINIFYDMPVF